MSEQATDTLARSVGHGVDRTTKKRPTPGKAGRTAAWLLPLVTEYAAKLTTWSDEVLPLAVGFNTASDRGRHVRAAQLLCWHDTVVEQVTDLARRASALIEQTKLEDETRFELTLRTAELEERLRFSRYLYKSLIDTLLIPGSWDATAVNDIVRQTGRTRVPLDESLASQ